MPRKSKAAMLLDEEEIPPTRAEIDIEEFLEEWAPQTSVVEIYECKKDGGMRHQERVGIEILQADLYGYLRENFGEGKYQLQFKDSNRQIRKAIRVEVGAGPKLNHPAPSVPLPSGNGDYLKELVIALIASMKPAPPPPPVDMGTLLAGLGTMITALKPSASDPAAMLTAMAQTFQQLKPAEDNVEKALTIISKAKDIAGEGSGSGDTWPGLIKEGIGAVAQVLRPNGNPSRPAIPPGAVPTGATLTTGAYPEATALNPVPEKSADDILQEWLHSQIAFLKTKALAGKDPDFWGEYIVENAEEPGCAAILEALRRGVTYQHLLTFDPEIGKNPVLAHWFQQLYAALLTDTDTDVDTPGPGGNAPDPGSDAKPSPS